MTNATMHISQWHQLCLWLCKTFMCMPSQFILSMLYRIIIPLFPAEKTDREKSRHLAKFTKQKPLGHPDPYSSILYLLPLWCIAVLGCSRWSGGRQHKKWVNHKGCFLRQSQKNLNILSPQSFPRIFIPPLKSMIINSYLKRKGLYYSLSLLIIEALFTVVLLSLPSFRKKKKSRGTQTMRSCCHFLWALSKVCQAFFLTSHGLFTPRQWTSV